MNKLIGKQISWNNALLGTVLAGIGLVGLLYAPAIVSIFSLSIASYWALRLVYGKEAVKQLFGKPIAPVKTISKYFLLNILISFLVSLVLQYGLKWDLHGNPVNEGFQWLTLLVIPIMLLGEELFSIFFLAIFSSKCTLPVASILSAIIFALSKKKDQKEFICSDFPMITRSTKRTNGNEYLYSMLWRLHSHDSTKNQ